MEPVIRRGDFSTEVRIPTHIVVIALVANSAASGAARQGRLPMGVRQRQTERGADHRRRWPVLAQQMDAPMRGARARCTAAPSCAAGRIDRLHAVQHGPGYVVRIWSLSCEAHDPGH